MKQYTRKPIEKHRRTVLVRRWAENAMKRFIQIYPLERVPEIVIMQDTLPEDCDEKRQRYSTRPGAISFWQTVLEENAPS